MRFTRIFLLTLLCFNAKAAEFSWLSRDGNPAPDSPSKKSIDGFGGSLVVTPDADWEEKWNTPSEQVPSFNEASDVAYGQTLFILTFFANPGIDAQGSITILCDIQVERPDQSLSIDTKDHECARGQIGGPRENVRLTNAILKYVGEAGDLPGVWHVRVVVKDAVSGIEIPLETSFNLKE